MRIAFVVSLVTLFLDEHEKVIDLSHDPKITFSFGENSTYVMPPPVHPGNNWLVRIKVNTSRKLTNACVYVKNVTKIGDESWPPVDVESKLGWYRGPALSFACGDVDPGEYFGLFHGQIDGRLQLFLDESVPQPAEYASWYLNVKPGEYKIAVLLRAGNIVEHSVTETFLVDWDGSMKDFHMKKWQENLEYLIKGAGGSRSSGAL